MRKCDYCGTLNENILNCSGCAAPLSDKSTPEHTSERCEPFSYNGYIAWPERDLMRNIFTVHFYLGDLLVESISVSHEVLMQFVPEACEYMPFFYDLLKVAQGEEEVFRIKEQNVPRPKMFEIRCVPSPQEEYARGLSMTDVYQAVREHQAVGVLQ